MGKQYMDYGSIISKDTYTIPKNLTQIDYNKKGQVYRLTHDGEGKSLSFMKKAFISFTYGGKPIEDFGLIAVTINDRLQRQTPPAHQDYITEYKMLNGQYYWGSHYNAREMSISLATDGMTQSQLDDFKYWFQAGEIKQLILAQHPNRGILARISEAPQISVLPFKKTQRVIVDSIEQEVEIIEYKGNIQLNFVMDDPFWYAIYDVLGKVAYDSYGHSLFLDTWVDANGEQQSILDNDAYKVMLEDHIPTGSMVNSQINFANGFTLQKYNERKYTLDNMLNKQNSKEEKGAPLTNDILNMIYPLTGAIIGPIYRIPYAEDQHITKILQIQTRTGIEVSSVNGLLTTRQYGPNETRLILKTITEYLPIKKGSTIKYIGSKSTELIRIAIYQKNDNDYSFKGIEVVDSKNILYTFSQDSFIRMTISVSADEWKESIDGQFNFSQIAELNLITFKDSKGITLSKDDTISYFYSGNAISYPIIEFSIPIHFDENGYIDTFSSQYSKHQNDEQYDSLILESEHKHQLKLTNPAIFSAYNQVIDILNNNEYKNLDIVSMIELMRNTVTHQVVRSWIINCINIYANNYNAINNTNILIVDDNFREQLLKYMPYLFVSYEDAEIEDRQGDPRIIQRTAEQLIQPMFERINSRLKLTSDNNIQVEIGDSFTISTMDNDNVLYYQWQYSKDGTKWYLIFDQEGKWSGSDSNQLTCLNVTEDDFGTYLRCIISNSTSYKGTDTTLKIVELNNNITITRTNTTVNINQGSSGTLQWNIVGEFSEQSWNNIDYYPELYYQPNGSGTYELWGSSKPSVNNNFNNQIQNGKLQISQNKKSIKFSFKALEGNNKTLRNTKFKIRLYKIDADNKTSSENYVESDSITINLKRLDISQAVVSLEATFNGNTETITDFSKECYFRGKNSAGNTTNLVLSITGIQNMIANQSGFYISSDGGKSWNKLTKGTPNITTTSATLSWTLDSSWNKVNNKIKFIAKGNNLQQYDIPQNQNIVICQIDPRDLDKEIDEFLNTLKPLSYNTSNLLQQYVGDTNITLSAYHGNIPTKADSYSFTYNWYYGNSATYNNNIIEINWQNTPIFTQVSQTLSNTFTLNNSNGITLANKGYYKCECTLSVIAQSGEEKTRTFTSVTEDFIYIDVIQKPVISNPQGSIINWTYYIKEQDIDDSQNNIININNTWTRTLTYTITGNYQKIVWYKIQNNATTILEEKTQNINSNYIIHNILSAKNFVDIYNNTKIYCVITDQYNNTYSSINLPINITILIKSQRAQDLKNNFFQGPSSFTWIWPCAYINKKYVATMISKKISYGGEWVQNEFKYKFNGIPLTEIANAINDEYPISAAKYQNKYNENINQWMPLIQIPIIQLNNYSQFQYVFLPVLSNSLFNLKIRVKQGDNILINESLLQNNIEKELLISNFSNNQSIIIEVLIYYNSTWPNNIGAYLLEEGTVLSNIDIYHQGNFPSVNNNTTYIILKSASGIIHTSTNGQRLMLRNRIGSNYVFPSIKQLCPISINCATGEYNMQIKYNTINWPQGILENIDDPKEICYLSSLRHNEENINNEPVGDMILLNKILFLQQNHFDKNNKIIEWSEQDNTLCHKITYNGDIPLQNFIMIYKNLYL